MVLEESFDQKNLVKSQLPDECWFDRLAFNIEIQRKSMDEYEQLVQI